MGIRTERYDDVDVVIIEGRIDSSNADDLDSAFKALTDNKRYKLIADLSGIEYMSSMGVRALISAKKTCHFGHGDLRLANPSEIAQEVIDIAGLEHVFEIDDTVEIARSNF